MRSYLSKMKSGGNIERRKTMLGFITGVVVGVVVGAAFAPFWIKVFNTGKQKVEKIFEKKN